MKYKLNKKGNKYEVVSSDVELTVEELKNRYTYLSAQINGASNMIANATKQRDDLATDLAALDAAMKEAGIPTTNG